jgi:hypothetical protein
VRAGPDPIPGPPPSFNGPRQTPGPAPQNDPTNPEVCSINAYDGQSYEFKTNCVGNFVQLETCFLWDVTAVVEEFPSDRRFEREKDSNINTYSGEVTRR